MDHDGGTGTNGPRNSITIQKSTIKKPKLSHKMEHRSVESLPPSPQVKFPEQNIPCQKKSIGGDTPQPSPVYGKGLLKENLMILDILPTNRPDPQTPETRGEGEVGGAEEPGEDPTFRASPQSTIS